VTLINIYIFIYLKKGSIEEKNTKIPKIHNNQKQKQKTDKTDKAL